MPVTSEDSRLPHDLAVVFSGRAGAQLRRCSGVAAPAPRTRRAQSLSYRRTVDCTKHRLGRRAYLCARRAFSIRTAAGHLVCLLCDWTFCFTRRHPGFDVCRNDRICSARDGISSYSVRCRCARLVGDADWIRSRATRDRLSDLARSRVVSTSPQAPFAYAGLERIFTSEEGSRSARV